MKEEFLGHKGDELHLLRDLYRTQQAMLNLIPRIIGISTSRLALLRLLAIELPKEAGVMEIARRLGINAAAVTRLVREMEEQGWVKRRSDSRDGRRNYVSLTPKGRQAFRKIHERMHTFERMMGETLDAKDVQATVRVLAALRDALERHR
ncbi:MAG TPA: MarR family transcriptional regulator [Syntrophales bacterium]|nr:MarR family transcriptional regulator [Syntrophales bacterium]